MSVEVVTTCDFCNKVLDDDDSYYDREVSWFRSLRNSLTLGQEKEWQVMCADCRREILWLFNDCRETGLGPIMVLTRARQLLRELDNDLSTPFTEPELEEIG